jgi:hypothetical protein
VRSILLILFIFLLSVLPAKSQTEKYVCGAIQIDELSLHAFAEFKINIKDSAVKIEFKILDEFKIQLKILSKSNNVYEITDGSNTYYLHINSIGSSIEILSTKYSVTLELETPEKSNVYYCDQVNN